MKLTPEEVQNVYARYRLKEFTINNLTPEDVKLLTDKFRQAVLDSLTDQEREIILDDYCHKDQPSNPLADLRQAVTEADKNLVEEMLQSHGWEHLAYQEILTNNCRAACKALAEAEKS